MSLIQYSLAVMLVLGAEMWFSQSCDGLEGRLVEVSEASQQVTAEVAGSALLELADNEGAGQAEAGGEVEAGKPEADKEEDGKQVKREIDPAAVKLLDELEEKGGKIKTFDARVNHVRIQELLGDQQVRMGRVMLIRGKDKTKFAIHFTTLITGGGKLTEQKRQFIFDGEWLVEKNYATKTYIKRQVIKPGEKFDPLKLGEGPFPLPLGQKREDVLKMFDAKMIEDPVMKDPQGKPLPARLHLQLTPRKDIPKSAQVGKFKKLDMWYEPEKLLPVKVQTTDGKNTTRVNLIRPEMNALKEDEQKQFFDITPPTGWNVIIKPFGDAG